MAADTNFSAKPLTLGKITTDRIENRVRAAFEGYNADLIQVRAERATASLAEHYASFIGGKIERRPEDFTLWFGRALEAFTADMTEGAELFEAVAYRTIWSEYSIDVQAFWDARNAETRALAAPSPVNAEVLS